VRSNSCSSAEPFTVLKKAKQHTNSVFYEIWLSLLINICVTDNLVYHVEAMCGEIAIDFSSLFTNHLACWKIDLCDKFTNTTRILILGIAGSLETLPEYVHSDKFKGLQMNSEY